MENNNKSYFMPIIVIFAGILFQLQAMGLIGASRGNLLEVAWPAIFIAAGLDLFFCSKRILGSAVLAFSGIAILIFNISGGTSETWNFFISFWPLMLILYGLDMLFSGKSITGSLLVIIIMAILIYAILGAKGIVPVPDVSLPTNTELSMKQPNPTGTVYPSESGQQSRQIDYVMPSQPAVNLELSAFSGKLQLKSSALENRVLSGSISLTSGENLTENIDQTESSVTYYLSSKAGTAIPESDSFWNLQFNQEKQLHLSSIMTSGYQMIDLRGMNLSGVLIKNENGNIDVMLPFSAQVPINLATLTGNIRIYVPKGVSANCTISGSGSISFPENYVQSGSVIYPVSQTGNVVTVNAQASKGTIKIISSPN